MESKITLDKLVRWGGIALSVLIVYYLVKILSGVLLPFFIAWLLAYLLNPMVKFVQHKMRVRSRVVSIIITMIAVIAVVALVILLIIPPMIGQFQKLGEVAIKFLNSNTPTNNVTEYIQQWFRENQEQVNNFFKSNDFTEALKVAMPKLFAFVGETANVVISIIASFITLLYMFFILLDYEFLTNNWIKIFRRREGIEQLYSWSRTCSSVYGHSLLHRIYHYRIPDGYWLRYLDWHSRPCAISAYVCLDSHGITRRAQGCRYRTEFLDYLWIGSFGIHRRTDYMRHDCHTENHGKSDGTQSRHLTSFTFRMGRIARFHRTDCCTSIDNSTHGILATICHERI